MPSTRRSWTKEGCVTEGGIVAKPRRIIRSLPLLWASIQTWNIGPRVHQLYLKKVAPYPVLHATGGQALDGTPFNGKPRNTR